MNKCPHCGADPCLPLWRKLSLGPSATARCRTCGYRVCVDFFSSWLAMLPTLLLVIAAVTNILRDPVTLVSLLVLCASVTLMLYAFWVPLERAELTNQSMVEAGRARIIAEKAAKE